MSWDCGVVGCNYCKVGKHHICKNCKTYRDHYTSDCPYKNIDICDLRTKVKELLLEVSDIDIMWYTDKDGNEHRIRIQFFDNPCTFSIDESDIKLKL